MTSPSRTVYGVKSRTQNLDTRPLSHGPWVTGNHDPRSHRYASPLSRIMSQDLRMGARLLQGPIKNGVYEWLTQVSSSPPLIAFF